MPKTSSMGLGKPTLRGVMKCPKCGTINGTRGNHCKNKNCNTVFKETSGKKKCSSEASRLITGTSTRVFSVRVRDKGPDYRGFVQLPVVQTPFAENSGLIESTALCFVDNCEGNFNAKVLQCHETLVREKTTTLCNHINGALRCSTEAQPLPVNTTVLEALQIDETCKEEIRTLLSESSGPTVQRVSRNVMAVKCRVTTKSPLGYLHVSFASGRSEEDIQFSCPCTVFKESTRNRSIEGRCSHFYACICAFVNQQSLREEFNSYIRLEVAMDLPSTESESVLTTFESSETTDSELTSLLEGAGCQVAILQEDVSNILSETITEDVSSILSKSNPEDAIVFSTVADLESQSIEALKVTLGVEQGLTALDDSYGEGKLAAINSLDLVPSVDLLSADLQGNSSFQYDLESSQLIPLFLETIVEDNLLKSPVKKTIGNGRPQLTFFEWLGSVTDAINNHMHYQFPGKPNSLCFNVHKKFFDKFKERMFRTRRKRLNSKVTIFTRRDKRPVGTFTKHSWTLTSRMHVKAIFDTPQIPLNLVRSFVQNDDGTFDPADIAKSINSQSLFKTYLRVGLHREETEPVPFRIDWIPGIYSSSNSGEMSVHFEFGHAP